MTDAQGFTILAIIVFVYFIPAVIAMSRRHHQKAAILVLNIFLGWTALGWIIALIWSFSAIQKPQGQRV